MVRPALLSGHPTGMIDTMDYAAARKNMVECQVRTNKVIDPQVIAALSDVPRELFAPAAMRSVAYIDEDLTVAPGRYLLEPMVIARLLQCAEVKPGERALEVATGTGYGAALLRAMGAEVVAVDGDPTVTAMATSCLAAAGVSGVQVVQAGVTAGLPERGPYDIILIPGAVVAVPEVLLAQLAEGGRLVTVVAGAGVGVGTVFVKAGGVAAPRPVFDAATPRLAEFTPAPQFSF